MKNPSQLLLTIQHVENTKKGKNDNASKYEEKDYTGLAKKIKQGNGTILLVWEHKAILKIANTLGIKENLSWDDNDFDSIWIITFINGSPKLTRDKENIKPSGNCQ